MTHTRMLATHPLEPGTDIDLIAACVAACFECAQACTTCADACLNEKSVADLTDCIRSDQDCADMCEATGRLLSRHTGENANLALAFLDTCAAACRACAEECEKHAKMHDHCRVCAEACRRCEQACHDLAAALR